jgi:molybdate transport system ATP-binding protein
MKEPVITAGFRKSFPGGADVVVHDFTLGRGVTVLFGESGSGKTTLLRCLAGLSRPDAGRITCQGRVWFDSTTRIALPARARRIGFLPQDYALFPHLSVARNVGYGLGKLSPAERANRVNDTLRWLGLQDLAQRLPSELSGGQQQRAALARAVAPHPGLLLLDEPLSALDAPTRCHLRGELRSWLCDLGIPALVVTHDRHEAAALGDVLVVLAGGRILQTGCVTDIFNRPAGLEVARIVGAETVQPCELISVSDGLATLAVAGTRVTALADRLPPGVTRLHLCIRAEDVILTREAAKHTSARNCFRAVIQAVEPEGPLIRIDLDCGFRLKACLTRQACEELAFRPGDFIIAMIKAQRIHAF